MNISRARFFPEYSFFIWSSVFFSGIIIIIWYDSTHVYVYLFCFAHNWVTWTFGIIMKDFNVRGMGVTVPAAPCYTIITWQTMLRITSYVSTYHPHGCPSILSPSSLKCLNQDPNDNSFWYFMIVGRGAGMIESENLRRDTHTSSRRYSFNRSANHVKRFA